MNAARIRLFAPLVLAALAHTPTSSSAATALPYLGPDQKKCGVIQPADRPEDAGFLTSEDCRFVYVFPPALGRFDTKSPVYLFPGAAQVCTDYHTIHEQLSKTALKPGDAGYASAAIRATQFASTFRAQFLEEYPGEQAFAVGAASLNWNQLIQAYRMANPTLNAQFTAMPIRIGILSIAGAETAANSPDSNDRFKYSVQVSSFQPPVRTVEDTAEVPTYLTFLQNKKNPNDFIMGQAVGLRLKLGIEATCALTANSAKDFLAGTYTYAYPVQTKGFVRYEFNKDYLVAEIKSFILSRKDAFTTQDLVEHMKSKNAFSVTVNEGMFPNAGMQDQLAEFKADLSTKAVEIFLGLLASQSAVSLQNSTTVTYTSHSERHCRRVYVFFKSCENYQWTTVNTSINWDRFANEMAAQLNVPAISGESYRTFYMMSTSAMVPSEGAKQ